MECNFYLGTATKKTVQEQWPLTSGSVIARSLQLMSTLHWVQRWFLYFGLACPLAHSHRCYESVVVCKQFWDRDAKRHVMYLWTDGSSCRGVEWTPSEGSVRHIQPRLTRDWFYGSVVTCYVPTSPACVSCKSHAVSCACLWNVPNWTKSCLPRLLICSRSLAVDWWAQQVFRQNVWTTCACLI